MNEFPITHDNILLEEVAGLRQAIADLFAIEEMKLNAPQKGYATFTGRVSGDSLTVFPEIKRRWHELGYTPMLREDAGIMVLIGMPAVFEPKPTRFLIPVLLFLATVLSTLFVGAANEEGFTGSQLWLGWPFSLSLLLILLAHEFGHYFAARYHKVDASLPHFIPMPFSPIGTFGAFIVQKERPMNRRVLFDIGVAGPLAGMVVALPVMIIGLLTSELGDLPTIETYLLEGNSLLYAALKILRFGRMLPADGVDVLLNQVAWAGWVGFLVTGLNLLPVAQLDGGHIAYTLFGKTARYFFWPVIIGVTGIGFLLSGGYQYALFMLLLIFMVGNRHAVPLDDVTKLDGKRKLIAVLTLLLFVLVFVPVPLTIITP